MKQSNHKGLRHRGESPLALMRFGASVLTVTAGPISTFLNVSTKRTSEQWRKPGGE